MKKKKNKTQFPVQLFFFFENLDIVYWKSSLIKKNHAVCLFSANTNLALAAVLKYENSLAFNQLLEATAVDLSNYSVDFEDFVFFQKNKFLCSYSYYFFFLKQRLTFFFPINLKLNAIDSLYNNAAWLEREISEMYGINFLKKKDSRNLLLDYGFLEHPMLKKYPCSGFSDVFFNTLKKSVVYTNAPTVEL